MAKTNQDWVAYTLDGNDHLGTLKRKEFSSDGNIVDGAAGNSSTFKACETSMTQKHDFELLMDASGECRATNLDVSVFTVGATAKIGSLIDGSVGYALSGSSSTRAINSLKEKSQATQRKYTVTGRFRVEDAEVLLALETMANSSTPSDRDVSITVTINAISFIIPMTMSNFKFSSSHAEVQEYTATFTSRAIATSPTGSSIIAVAFTGDGLLTLVSNSGSGQRSGTGLIESMNITAPNNGLVTVTGSLLMQSGYTLATS